jgi:hypothetical protein
VIDPESTIGLRPSHRRVIQLFRRFGPMTDEEALEAAISDGWAISPSGLRSRRAEVTPPRGRGIRDSGHKRETAQAKKKAIVWEVDE